MRKHLLARASGSEARIDDDESAIQRRIDVWKQDTLHVLRALDMCGDLEQVATAGTEGSSKNGSSRRNR